MNRAQVSLGGAPAPTTLAPTWLRVHNAPMLVFWLFACDLTLYANLPEAPTGDAATDSTATEETAPTADTGT